ncbi:hypothetical protein CC79DRAFT_74845 [Sarocladium strictum]
MLCGSQHSEAVHRRAVYICEFFLVNSCTKAFQTDSKRDQHHRCADHLGPPAESNFAMVCTCGDRLGTHFRLDNHKRHIYSCRYPPVQRYRCSCGVQYERGNEASYVSHLESCQVVERLVAIVHDEQQRRFAEGL